MYEDRFWKKNWDEGVDDLDPNLFETTFVNIIEKAFQDVPDKTAMGFLGIDVTFRQLSDYANQFANMLLENGFKKGDVVGINLPNIPQYVISVIGTLRAGCVVSGVSRFSLQSRSNISSMTWGVQAKKLRWSPSMRFLPVILSKLQLTYPG